MDRLARFTYIVFYVPHILGTALAITPYTYSICSLSYMCTFVLNTGLFYLNFHNRLANKVTYSVYAPAPNITGILFTNCRHAPTSPNI